MQLNDPRAAGFNAAQVRSALEFAMKMGMPEMSSERVRFVFRATHTYTREDPIGLPYEWDAAPATTVGEDREVEVPVAMEFVSRVSQGRDTSMGFILPAHVELYIMDTYINEVRDADEVFIDTNRYRIMSWPPPIGLFDFTLYPCLVEAVDE